MAIAAKCGKDANWVSFDCKRLCKLFGDYILSFASLSLAIATFRIPVESCPIMRSMFEVQGGPESR